MQKQVNLNSLKFANSLDEMSIRRLFYGINRHVQHFYALSDPGHQWDHSVSVTELAMLMNQKLNLGVNTVEIIFAGLLHDIGLYTNNRDEHEIIGARLVQSDYRLEGIRMMIQSYDIELNDIVNAILTHRASFSGEYRSVLCELISSADRLYPSVHQLVKRMILCYNNFEESYKKIRDKYIVGGYARWPKIYTDYFGETFMEFQRYLKDEKYVRSIYTDLTENNYCCGS